MNDENMTIVHSYGFLAISSYMSNFLLVRLLLFSAAELGCLDQCEMLGAAALSVLTADV